MKAMPRIDRKLPTSAPCWPWVGSVEGQERQAEHLGDDGAGALQDRHQDAPGDAEDGADGDLLEKKENHRLRRRRQRRVVAAHQREQHEAQRQRDPEAEPRRDHRLAEAGQQHHQRADPREDEDEADRQRRDDVEGHDTPPPARAAVMATVIARSEATKQSRASLPCAPWIASLRSQ